MLFEANDDQRQLVDAVRTLVKRQAGTERAAAMESVGHDDALLESLTAAGFLDIALDEDLGPLGAALVVEQLSRAVGWTNFGPRLLVAPFLLGNDAPPRVALVDRAHPGPVRFGAQADAVLILDGDEALVADVRSATAVPSKFVGYPFATLALENERSLGPGSGDRLRRWWQVAVAVEISGAVGAALDRTVRYLSERHQFGQPLAAFQALQHRLAEAFVTSDTTLWLARVAAARHAARVDAAAAAAYSAAAAHSLGTDLHQLTGAIGFTVEYELHHWTTRLHALRLELGGAHALRRELAAATWG